MSTKIGSIESKNAFTIGCLSKSLRGPVDVPVALTSIAQDKVAFGEHANAYVGGFIRRGVFNALRLRVPSVYNASSMNGLVGAVVHTVRVLASDAVTATLTLVDDTAETPGDSWVVTSGYLGHASPGVDGNNVKVEVKVTEGQATQRDLLVSYKSPLDGNAYVLRETFTGLTNANVVASVTGVSKYVNVAIADGATKVPAVVAATALATGANGSAVDDADYVTASTLLENLDLPVVVNADLDTAAIATYATAQGSTVDEVASGFGKALAALAQDVDEFLQAREYLHNRVETVTLAFRSLVQGVAVEAD